jgi:hypothetical protein
MRNISDRIYTENQTTHSMFNSFFFLNLAVYEIMWDNMVQPAGPQMTLLYGALYAG